MRCHTCNSESSPGKKFCLRCGSRLDLRCSRCGSENPADASFCGDCGAPLSTATSTGNHPSASSESTAPHRPPTAVSSHEGERRRLSVLFCDLVGSTAIASRLDPEEWRETVRGYQSVAADAINRFGGHVAQYLGDGVLAYFGWPEAHDNDAERAARAGLAILAGLVALNNRDAKSDRPKLSVRVGIDTGNVVIGKGSGGESEVFGDTANIASRVQSAAAPD